MVWAACPRWHVGNNTIGSGVYDASGVLLQPDGTWHMWVLPPLSPAARCSPVQPPRTSLPSPAPTRACLPCSLRPGRFPDGGKWGHCTSTDLVHWNCSHPSTNFGSGDTGGISVTPKGTFALWPVGARPLADGSSRWAEFPHRLMVCLQGIDMAVPTGPDLETWVKKGKVDNGGGQRDPGRAIKLKSGWYVPVSSAPKPFVV
eukprot:COSAG04_NODE_9066_length_902_cov_1.103362_1_plen_202_part_00